LLTPQVPIPSQTVHPRDRAIIIKKKNEIEKPSHHNFVGLFSIGAQMALLTSAIVLLPSTRGCLIDASNIISTFYYEC
jgi:hypothetical protein